MKKNIGSKALIPNPALKPFEIMLGEWKTTGTHPYMPDLVLTGRTVIEWTEGGAFLIIRSEIDHPKFPDGVALIGSDDVAGKFFMLYFDERGTSREFNVTISGTSLKWWRDEPTFSQRTQLTIESDASQMVSKGEMSQGGAEWEKDLSLIYRR